MNYKLLALVLLNCLSLGSLHGFVLVNNSVHSLCIKLDWYAPHADTQAMELARVDRALQLDAQTMLNLELNSQYEQVWVTLLYQDGTQEEPFKLIVEPYEPDKSIDTTCALIISDVNQDEVKFKLQGKKFVEMARKAALIELLKRQKALAQQQEDKEAA